jgi:hypothetical protein
MMDQKKWRAECELRGESEMRKESAAYSYPDSQPKQHFVRDWLRSRERERHFWAKWTFWFACIAAITGLLGLFVHFLPSDKGWVETMSQRL